MRKRGLSRDFSGISSAFNEERLLPETLRARLVGSDHANIMY